MAKPRALITGITGMVGSHLAEYLVANTDWDVVGLCRWRSPLDNIRSLVPRINRKDRVTLVYGDLRDSLSIQEAVRQSKPDYVFHLAAQSFPRTSFDAPLDTSIPTCKAPRASSTPSRPTGGCDHSRLLLLGGVWPRAEGEAADRRGVHLPPGFALRHLQGRHRSHRTLLCRSLRHDGHGDAHVHPHGPTARRRLCRVDLRQADRHARSRTDRAGRQGRNLDSLRTVADVRDAVRAYHMLVTIKPTPGAYYNIGSSHSCTVRQMLETLVASSPRRAEIRIEVDPDRLRSIDADLQVPDTSKFTTHTGWRPLIPYEQSLADLLDYWRERVAQDGDSFLTR